MSDPKRFLLSRSASYLHCDHGDGLNHASFDVEKLMSEYAAAVLEDVAFNLWRNGAEPITSVATKRAEDRRYALDKLRERAAQEKARRQP